jgi:hypothetical protein
VVFKELKLIARIELGSLIGRQRRKIALKEKGFHKSGKVFMKVAIIYCCKECPREKFDAVERDGQIKYRGQRTAVK